MTRLTHTPLILASASPRRLDLLAQIAIVPDEVRPADIDETPRRDESPRALALRLAEGKANAVWRPGEAYVLGADTVVAVGRRSLPKTVTDTQARACLEALSGRAHMVYTGIAVFGPDGRRGVRVVTSRVSFKRLSSDEMTAYLASGDWHGKAGGYAIQGQAGAFIPRLNGSYSAVVGLPLCETRALLTGLGWRPPPA